MLCMDSEEVKEPNIKGDPLPSDLLEQWKFANQLKMHQDNLSWVIFSIFWAANAFLLVAVFQNSDARFTLMKWIVIPLFGIVLSVFWYFIQARVITFKNFYENLVDRFEINHNIPKEFQTGWNNKIYYQKYVTGVRVKPIMKFIPIFGIILWVILLVIGPLLIGQ